MNEWLSLSGIVLAIAVGAVSPGPSFLMVARTAVSHGRQAGLAAALGMGLGAFLFAEITLLGLTTVLAAVPWLYASFKVAGGLYLLVLGWRIWRGATEGLQVTPETGVEDDGPTRGWWRWFAVGLATQMSNPKTAVVYAGVFAAFMPKSPSWLFHAAVLVVVAVIESGWYAIVAGALSAPKSRATYLRYKSGIDRVAGSVMGVLGVKLASSATTP